MKRSNITRSLLVAFGLALTLAAMQAQAQPRIAAPRGNCYLNQLQPGSDQPPTQALNEAEKSALDTALQDEYKSRATYNKVLDTFGEVLPFAHIVNAEGRHVEALVYLHTRYGVAIPEDAWAEKIPEYATLKEAAEAAVQGEVENGALYDTLMADVTNAEVLNVFKALQFATNEHHLPAFQRLVAFENGQPDANGRGMGQGSGRGMGRGMGCGGCCAYGTPAGNGPGRGMGLGAPSMRGRNNAGTPGRGKGLNANPGYGRGNGLGMGYGRGAGRGAGRGFNPPVNCPRFN